MPSTHVPSPVLLDCSDSAARRDRARARRARSVEKVEDGGDLIDSAVALWQPSSSRQLTREDGREIVENLTGFFRLLQEWDRAERRARRAPRLSPD